MPTYNADAVQRAIDRDPTIGPAEGKTIHALLRGRARSRSPGCTCYVASLDAESRFGLRWGAHGLACPRYRRSLDPIDDAQDQDYRTTHSPGQ